MSNIDTLFAEILRFSIIALVMLSATLVAVRVLKQPLERMRLIQISLLALVATIVLGLLGVVPALRLALLPVDDNVSSVADTTGVDDAMGPVQGSTQTEAGDRSRLPLDGDMLDSRGTVVTAAAASGQSRRASPEAGAISADETGNLQVIPVAKTVFVYGCLLISLLNALYLAFGLVATYRLISSSKSLSAVAADRATRIVDQLAGPRRRYVARSANIHVPMVSGIWRPTILLPEKLARSDADEMELKHSLAHEWGHIVRHDLLVWQLMNLGQVFLWIQPLYWILRRELRIAQDQLADEFATQQTEEHATYAETLLALSRARQISLPGALAMAGRKSNLYRRIEMLLNDKFRMVCIARKSVMLPFAVSILLVGVLLMSLQLTHAATPAGAANEDGEQGDQQSADQESSTDVKSAEHSGEVIDADTNEPIAGVTVIVTRMNSGDWRELAVTESVTDENGKYTFTIPPDQLRQRLLYIMFDIDHPSYARRHCGSYGYGMIVKNLENGEPPWFSQFKMVRGEKVSGRLVDENGQPVAGAELRFQSAPKSGYDRVRSSWVRGTSSDDGRFEALVTHDGTAKFSVIPTDHCMHHIELGEKRGDLGDIVLQRGIPIEGVVQDARGQPMADLWVNLTPEDQRYEASYEMKRSSKTDEQGVFRTRPVKPGKYLVNVELKATGALEKQKYANFHDTPPSAMFVEQTINVAQDSTDKPAVIRAVPHVLISLQFFKPDGETSSGHSPNMFGNFDGRRMWIHGGKQTGEGAYELMAPHGFEDVELRFSTNEHSALMVQFAGGELSPQDAYRFERLEEDIRNIRVVRHPAAIAKIKIVDEDGKHRKDAVIYATYAVDENADDRTRMGNQIGWNREGELFRLSSIVPNCEFSVRASLTGHKPHTEFITMNEGERRTITITLKKDEDGASLAGE